MLNSGAGAGGQGGNCPSNFYMKGQNSPNFLGIKKNVVARKPIDSQIIQLETITQSLIPYQRSADRVYVSLGTAGTYPGYPGFRYTGPYPGYVPAVPRET